MNAGVPLATSSLFRPRLQPMERCLPQSEWVSLGSSLEASSKAYAEIGLLSSSEAHQVDRITHYGGLKGKAAGLVRPPLNRRLTLETLLGQ